MIDAPESISLFRSFDGGTTCSGEVFHVPYADGEATTTHLATDSDDGATAMAEMCLGVHWLDTCKCTNFNATCAPPSYVEGPWLDCDL
ncbi:MAG: hypothetical protein KC766_16455 [Myxococcales bacterium]|nr:hypothetical protein [Myxococcales bacterium]